jgi:hypothetical protein
MDLIDKYTGAVAILEKLKSESVDTFTDIEIDAKIRVYKLVINDLEND